MNLLLKATIKNYEWLSEIANHAGIVDPIEKKVINHHYALSHYFLTSCALWAITGKPEFRKNAENTLLRFSSKITDWKINKNYHWEFDDYAIVEGIYILAAGEDYRKYLSIINKLVHHNLPYATNWQLLLASFLWRRGVITGSLRDNLFSSVYRMVSLTAMDSNGCILDVPAKSNSFQYHAFSTAILLRWAIESHDEQLISTSVLALKYLSEFVTPDGIFGYHGRGQLQLFGQAAAIYCFTVGAEIERKYQQDWRKIASLMIDNVLKLQSKEGWFPLVMREGGEVPGPGWYEYNFLSVYNSFASAWFSLALLNKKRLILKKKERKEYTTINRKQAHSHFEIQTSQPTSISLKNKNMMVVVSSQGSSQYYLSDCGYSIDLLWIKGIGSVSIAPGVSKKIKSLPIHGRIVESLSENYYSPTIINTDNSITPLALLQSRFVSRWASGCELQISSEFCDAFRWIVIRRSGIEVIDEVCLHENANALVLLNIPILTLSRTLELSIENRILTMEGLSCKITGHKASLSLTDEKLQTAGLTRSVQMIILKPKKNYRYSISHFWHRSN